MGMGILLRKEDNDWVKKCMEYESESCRPRGTPEDLDRGCQAHKLSMEDVMDHGRWRKLIKDGG